jgi:hypothetical protein
MTQRKPDRVERVAKKILAVPTNWLDPLLTGPRAILKGQPGTWGCPEVEDLLRAIKKRMDIEVQVILRKEHAWFRRMVNRLQRPTTAYSPYDEGYEDALSEILNKLTQRRK